MKECGSGVRPKMVNGERGDGHDDGMVQSVAMRSPCVCQNPRGKSMEKKVERNETKRNETKRNETITRP